MTDNNILPELNVDLLDKTLSHIQTLEAFRREGVVTADTWNQGVWAQYVRDEEGVACGTAKCFAGWAVTLAGHQLVLNPNAPDRHCPGCEDRTLVVEMPDGSTRTVGDLAEELLGLVDDEGDLFEGDLELADLERMVDEIKAGKYREETAS